MDSCFGNFYFQLAGKNSVNLDTPLPIEYFKFFHFNQNECAVKTPSSLVCCGSAQHHSEPPVSNAPHIVMPPININMPPKLFQMPHGFLASNANSSQKHQNDSLI